MFRYIKLCIKFSIKADIAKSRSMQTLLGFVGIFIRILILNVLFVILKVLG